MVPSCTSTSGAGFRKQHLADRKEVPLSLQHAGELRHVRLQPVLLLWFALVVTRRLSIIVLMLSLSSATSTRFLNGPRRSPFVAHSRHLDGAHLRGEIGCQEVHVAGQIFPRACGAGRWPDRSRPFDADLTGHVRDLIGERGRQ